MIQASAAGSKQKFRDIWHIFKQVWYIPFIWSLAWFSYWIAHSFIAYKLSLTEIESLNYYGFFISIAFLIIAGYTSGESRKKTSINKTLISSGNKKESSFSQVYNKENPSLLVEELEQEREKNKIATLSASLEPQSIVKRIQVQKPSEQQKLKSVSTSNDVSSDEFKQSDHRYKSKETTPDCLVCPKLVSCPQRQKRIFDPEVPCPYENGHK